ncbi:hypothetical protein KCU87_g219, partial [Aureobasidium melanogenum]
MPSSDKMEGVEVGARSNLNSTFPLCPSSSYMSRCLLCSLLIPLLTGLETVARNPVARKHYWQNEIYKLRRSPLPFPTVG